MADLSRFNDPAWERFFQFVFPCDEKLDRGVVQAELKRLGIGVEKAFGRVQKALAAAKGRAELADARSRRLGVSARLAQVIPPAVDGLREWLRKQIARMAGGAQAALFRKLEAAATDEDLQSLREDIHRLDSLSEEATGGEPPV